MAGETTTSNMSLTVPAVGVTAGPAYASEMNANLQTLDQHNHTPGLGVQVPSSGLNINAALPMNNNALTTINSLQFQVQSASQALASLCVIGVDLYYTDGSGNIVRVTQGGAVSGATGTITGLPSGTASASYSAGTFTFQSATNTAANIDAGSYIYRNSTVSSNGLTLQPPNAMASNYSLTLPALPAQTNVMSLDTSGNMGSITYDQVGQGMTSVGANAVAASRTRATGTSVGLGGVAIATSSGSYAAINPTGNTLVTNQSITLVTSGRPVMVMLQPDTTLNPNTYIESTAAGNFIIYRDGSPIRLATVSASNPQLPPGLISCVDVVTGGSHSYALYVQTSSGANMLVFNCSLTAYEL